MIRPPVDSDSWMEIVWEDDEMSLPDIFESLDESSDEHFIVYRMRYEDEDNGDIVDGYIGFHFNDRTIWKQVSNEALTTQLCTIQFARKNDPDLAEDYDYARREFRKLMRQAEKKNRLGRVIRKEPSGKDNFNLIF